jgi:hypothetical protein
MVFASIEKLLPSVVSVCSARAHRLHLDVEVVVASIDDEVYLPVIRKLGFVCDLSSNMWVV